MSDKYFLTKQEREEIRSNSLNHDVVCGMLAGYLHQELRHRGVDVPARDLIAAIHAYRENAKTNLDLLDTMLAVLLHEQ